MNRKLSLTIHLFPLVQRKTYWYFSEIYFGIQKVIHLYVLSYDPTYGPINIAIQIHQVLQTQCKFPKLRVSQERTEEDMRFNYLFALQCTDLLYFW